MMERHLDEQLKKLNTDLIRMATMAEDAIYRSIEALKDRDVDMAEQVIVDDTSIDELEIEIEEEAIDLLATKQPVAFDLRFLATAIKINAEIERIADLAVNIAQRVKELRGEPLLKPLIDIPKLAELARKMVRGSIDAFVERDEKLAENIILLDPEADQLRNMVQQELVNDYLVKDGKDAPRAMPLFLISRHLERICDHATYIAEDVIYLVKAEVIKHHRDKLEGAE